MLGVLCLTAFALSACGGPLEEQPAATAAAQQAIGLPPPPPPPPICPAYPASMPYQSQLRGCVQARLPSLNGRAFDSTSFEHDLQFRGCSMSLVGLSGDTLGFPVTPYNITACPSSCSMSTLLWSYVGKYDPQGHLYDPHASAASPWSCLPAPPAGVVYVDWDPKCPGGCPPVLTR
jgi:hypothetical protein